MTAIAGYDHGRICNQAGRRDHHPRACVRCAYRNGVQDARSERSDEIAALHTLIADLRGVATGRLRHRKAGHCPTTDNPFTRDSDCDACAVLQRDVQLLSR